MKEGSEKVREKFEKNGVDREYWEKVDTSQMICPNCQAVGTLFWVFTKRGVSIKCKKCGMDTHMIQDIYRHRQRELEVIPILKQMFPQLTFIENVPIDTNVLTGEVGKSPVKYDFKVFFFDKKLARCKVSVVQNTKLDHYLKGEEQYLFGRQDMIDYLAKIDGILIWYFPDDGKKIAMAYVRDIKKFAVEVTDRFSNKQYHLVKEIRRVVIKTSYEDFKTLLFRNLYDLLTRNVYVV